MIFSPKFWLGALGGLAAGYVAGRLMEAKDAGVPMSVSLERLGTSVARLREQAAAAAGKLRNPSAFVPEAEPEKW